MEVILSHSLNKDRWQCGRRASQQSSRFRIRVRRQERFHNSPSFLFSQCHQQPSLVTPAIDADTSDMADEEKPKNRKERRAAAKQSGKPVEPPTKMPNIKLAHPEYGKPKEKTLLDLYEEKKDLLDKGRPFDNKYTDGLPRGESGNILEAGLGDGEPIGPVGDAIFWAVCLGMFHFTLDVLVYNQYAQDVIWPAIFKRSGTILPILFMVIYMVRSETAKKLGVVRQLLLFGMAVGSGCYLIHAGNVYSYFAVMKQAPPLGTLWVFSVIELDKWFGLASLVFNLGFLLWYGYTVF